MAGFKHITNFQRKGFVGDDVIAVSVPSRKELSATFDNDNVVMVSISRADDLMTNDLHGNVHGAVSVDGHLRYDTWTLLSGPLDSCQMISHSDMIVFSESLRIDKQARMIQRRLQRYHV